MLIIKHHFVNFLIVLIYVVVCPSMVALLGVASGILPFPPWVGLLGGLYVLAVLYRGWKVEGWLRDKQAYWQGVRNRG